MTDSAEQARADALRDMGAGKRKKARAQGAQRKLETQMALQTVFDGKGPLESTDCSECKLPFPPKQLTDGKCLICRVKLGEVKEPTSIDLFKRPRTKRSANSAQKPAKVPKPKPELPDIEVPEGPLPRGWISAAIRQLHGMGYEKSTIAATLTKALGRDVKYQQVFQVLTQDAAAARAAARTNDLV